MYVEPLDTGDGGQNGGRRGTGCDVYGATRGTRTGRCGGAEPCLTREKDFTDKGRK